jgi:hypothetical protein
VGLVVVVILKMLCIVVLTIVGMILSSIGVDLSDTYDMTKPICERPPMTDTERFGKFLQVLSILFFDADIALAIRWLIDYFYY